VSGIYVASKAFRGPMWRALRENGLPICSTWIDESEPGQTFDWEDLWLRCLREASEADTLVLYWEAGEVLKGALVEVGIALGHGIPIIWVGPELSVCHHPSVIRASSLKDGIDLARELVPEINRGIRP
jgi:hypothetical protein